MHLLILYFITASDPYHIYPCGLLVLDIRYSISYFSTIPDIENKNKLNIYRSFLKVRQRKILLLEPFINTFVT